MKLLIVDPDAPLFRRKHGNFLITYIKSEQIHHNHTHNTLKGCKIEFCFSIVFSNKKNRHTFFPICSLDKDPDSKQDLD